MLHKKHSSLQVDPLGRHQRTRRPRFRSNFRVRASTRVLLRRCRRSTGSQPALSPRSLLRPSPLPPSRKTLAQPTRRPLLPLLLLPTWRGRPRADRLHRRVPAASRKTAGTSPQCLSTAPQSCPCANSLTTLWSSTAPPTARSALQTAATLSCSTTCSASRCRWTAECPASNRRGQSLFLRSPGSVPCRPSLVHCRRLLDSTSQDLPNRLCKQPNRSSLPPSPGRLPLPFSKLHPSKKQRWFSFPLVPKLFICWYFPETGRAVQELSWLIQTVSPQKNLSGRAELPLAHSVGVLEEGGAIETQRRTQRAWWRLRECKTLSSHADTDCCSISSRSVIWSTVEIRLCVWAQHGDSQQFFLFCWVSVWGSTWCLSLSLRRCSYQTLCTSKRRRRAWWKCTFYTFNPKLRFYCPLVAKTFLSAPLGVFLFVFWSLWARLLS